MKKQILQLSLAATLSVPASALAQNVFPTNGNVGIGTSNPARLLDISGNGNSVEVVLRDPRQPVDQRNWRVANAGGLFAIEAVNDALSGGRNVISFVRNGNIGIGTTTPQSTLDVIGTVRARSITLTEGPAGGTYIGSAERIHITTANKQPIHLLPDGGIVDVGASTPMTGILKVYGVTQTGTLELTSDRNQKRDFQPVSASDLLAKVAALPVTTWAYTNSPGVRHLGPMAQDFKAAFNLGEDDKHIGAGDGIGVALAAIKELNDLVQERNARISALETKLANLESRLNVRVAVIEKSSEHFPEKKQ